MKKRRDNPRDAGQHTNCAFMDELNVTFARSLTEVLHYLGDPSTVISHFKHCLYTVLVFDRATYPRYSTAER